MSFKDKVALVVGGGSGMGLACAQAIGERGGRVVIASRREEVLRDAAKQLGPLADWVRCDVADEDSVEKAVSEVVSRHGKLNLAVNAAGMGGFFNNFLHDVSCSAEFRQVLEVNLLGTFRCIRAQARAMRAHGGSIVNISSTAAISPMYWMSDYCVSKAGVNMLTSCAATELGEHGIRVNAIMPSLVQTEMTAGIIADDESRGRFLEAMAIRRVGSPGDIAAAACFLLSDEASWITGQCIGVEGGATLRWGPDLRPLIRQVLPPGKLSS